jgi:hypothetical protein
MECRRARRRGTGSAFQVATEPAAGTFRLVVYRDGAEGSVALERGEILTFDLP